MNRMTEGNPLKLLLVFGAPILLGNLFQQLYNLTDAIIVGKFVGTQGLAAVGAVGALQYFFISFCAGMSSGVGIIVAQYYGAGDDEGVRKGIINGILATLSVAVLMTVLGVVFADECIRGMNTPPEIIFDCIKYLKSICVGIVGICLYNTMAEILRALGDSRTPLIFLVVAALTNIVLDLVFIIYFDLGVQGAGVATAVAQMIAAVGVMIYAMRRNLYFTFKRKELKVEKELFARSFTIGIPVACQFSLIAVSGMVLQIVVNGFGAIIVATCTVASKIENIMLLPYVSSMTSLQAYSGQNIGAGDNDRVISGFKNGTLIIMGYTLIIAPIIFFGGHYFIQIFTSDPQVIEVGRKALKICSLFYPGLGMIFVTRGILNGVGDSKFAFMGGVLEVTGRACLPTLLTSLQLLGVWGIWLATGITWFLTALLGIVRFWQKKWMV